MTSQISRRYQLAQRPSGLLGHNTFSFVETPLDRPAEGQILVRNEYLSLDPTTHGRTNNTRSYIPPAGIGEVIRALGVGRVLAPEHPGFQTGDYVSDALGVQNYFAGEPKGFYKVDPSRTPLPCCPSALGMTSIATYLTLLDIGQPKSGETVVVFGAADAVGSVVRQIAKLKGYRVVGIAGGAKKCRFLVEELGFDGAINYKDEDLIAGLKREYPEGIDVLFDNVDGEILDMVLTRTAFKARVVLYGVINQYSNREAVRGPANYLSLLVNRACTKDMVVMDYVQRFPEGLREMVTWLTEGKPQLYEDIAEGLKAFPETLLRLFSRGNFGKLMLKV